MGHNWIVKYYVFLAAFWYFAYYITLYKGLEMPPKFIPVNAWLFFTLLALALGLDLASWYFGKIKRLKALLQDESENLIKEQS